MRKVSAVLAAVAALAVSAPAFASTCTVGDCFVTGGTLDFGSPVAIQNSDTPLGPVDDQGFITVAPNVPAGLFFVDVNFDEILSGDTVVRAGYSNLVVEFFENAASIGSFQITNDAGVQILQTFFLSLISGADLDFRITGTSFRNAGASLPDYNIDIEAIPVPGALPLLLSGIAGLAFAGRRRKAKA